MSEVMEQKPKETSKATVVIVIILVTIAVIAGVALYLNKQNTKKSTSTNESQSNINTKAGNVVANSADVDTACYSFTVSRTTSFGSRDECSVELTYGGSTSNNLSVAPGLPTDFNSVTGQARDLDSAVAAYKASLGKTSTVSEASKAEVSGWTTMRFVYTPTGTNKRSIMILSFKPKTSSQGQVSDVETFTLKAAYGTDEQQQVIKGVVDTWKWK